MKIFRQTLLLLIIAVSVALVTGCPFDDGDYDDYSASSNPAYLNPERGWYIARETGDIGDLKEFRSRGVSIVLLEANLKGYASRDLDTTKLNQISTAFNRARTAGLSVIFRAAYTFDGNDYDNYRPNNPFEPEMTRILKHIDQLKPIFTANEDILLNVQAGFLGVWGEWHTSRFSLKKDDPPSKEDRKAVLDALLAAVPSSVTIAVRRPSYIRDYTGNNSTVSEGQAFGTSNIARLAFHNDALMSDDTDMDTYPEGQRESELNWISRQTQYTPMVGETNLVSSYNDTNNAVVLLNRINIQSLNLEYHEGVLGKWQNSQHDGMNAFDYISMRMGYRFVLNKANLPETVNRGGTITLDLAIENKGFGNLLKKKDFELILQQGQNERRFAINADARKWNNGTVFSYSQNFTLPSNIATGDWNVYLGLTSPDYSGLTSLKKNPAYSIKFANTNKPVWDSELGLNKIGVIKVQ